ncbi:hypothetical protein [Streptomyces sp. A1547]|uniref:hypothetical protein n=1 Tax=Streptomyces sp. A1547 TaxID=2563105 RepID=UPI00109E4FB8|nr:hypothetical protein [Streptomyces sp. A1547]THA33720.1 hypothetical protein E6W17_30965 [Streptomyces sp. A1547]
MTAKLDAEQAKREMIASGAWPIAPYTGVGKAWPSICMECGELCETPSYSNVVRRGQGPCKPCGTRRNAERLRHPQAYVVAVFKALGAQVIGTYENNRTPIDCICLTCNSKIRPTYSNALRPGIGLCNKDCKRLKIGNSNRGDAASAIALAVSHGLEPVADYTRADDPWPCKCTRTGEIVSPTYSNIKQMGHVCEPCGRQRTAAARRLDPNAARAVMGAAGLTPHGSYPGRVDVPWPCTCRCGTELSPGPRLSDIRSGQGGCHNCSDTAFKLDDPGWVYLVVHPELGFVKWGKSTKLEKRLTHHRYQGFTDLQRTWPFETGREASAAERRLGQWIREQGALRTIDQQHMRYKGYTETASLEEISLVDLVITADRITGEASAGEGALTPEVR